VARGWVRGPQTVAGSNAGGNAASDGGRNVYIPRVQGFRWDVRGPVLASTKSPRFYPTSLHASARRPRGAGWAPFRPARSTRGPDISPQPRGFGQEWRHVSAPRAYLMGRFR